MHRGFAMNHRRNRAATHVEVLVASRSVGGAACLDREDPGRVSGKRKGVDVAGAILHGYLQLSGSLTSQFPWNLHVHLPKATAAKLKRLGHVTLTFRLTLVAQGGHRITVDAAGHY